MLPIRHLRPQARRQRGAVIITVALVMLFLLGFMGIALDLGRLFIVKTELQTAMDSCALAAAQELDGLPDAISRADSAGVTASNTNRVNLQSADWSGQQKLTAATGITYRTATYTETTDPAAARYAECQHVQPSVQMWLLHIMSAVQNVSTDFPTTRNVGARAVATRGSSQTTCPIPIALKRAAGTDKPLYGFSVGEWVKVWGKDLEGTDGGEFGWYNLDESQNAKSTKDQLEGGVCNTRLGATLRTPGAKTAVDVVWNYRFGIYKNNVIHSEHPPDYSGYAYTATNWTNPPPQNAWSGTPFTGSHASAASFLTKRSQYRSFDDTANDLQHGSEIVFGDPNKLKSGGFKDVATPGTTGEHHQLGGNRRLALVPVIDENSRVIDYLCIFMLHPLTGPNDDAYIELRANAGAIDSPCTTAGLPGGAAGPLVPVLVR